MRLTNTNSITLFSFLFLFIIIILLSIDHSILKTGLENDKENNKILHQISQNFEKFKSKQDMHNNLFMEQLKINQKQKMISTTKTDEKKKFEKKIHFTWKEEFENLEEKSKEYQRVMKWKDFNPKYQIKYFSDQKSLKYVEKHFDRHPNIINVYNKFPKNIFRADFFRYLVVYNEGG